MLYVERDKSEKVMSFIKLKDANTLIRYDGVNKERHLTKYHGSCMLAHRFEARESWVTVVSESHEISGQTIFPDSWLSMMFGPKDTVHKFTMTKKFVASCLGILGRNIPDFMTLLSKGAKRLASWDLNNSVLFIENHWNVKENACRIGEKGT